MNDGQLPEAMNSAKVLPCDARSLVSLNDVSLRLHDKILFEGLCWEMLDNQHWAVIGPNGSGKSALMKALCGSVPIIKGKLVYHFIRDGGQNGAPQDQIAYVTFESQRMVLGDEAFYQARWNVGVNEDTLSVNEYLSERGVKSINPYHVVESHSDQKFAARRQEIIEQLELGALLERNVIQLSNGERRKVLIARALLKSPRLLILDNPFAGLDERFRIKLEENLENLMQGDMRVLIVGTSRDEIPPSITHVLCVKDNRVIAQGPRQTVLNSDAAHEVRRVSQLANLPMVAASQRNDEHEPPRKALVHMENINVSYNGTQVLRQVSWTVRENEQWALLGPNGAGKTTLLSLILADNPQAYAHDITLFGRRRGSGESIWEIKQNIGWVAPELHLYYPRGVVCLDVVCSGFFDSVGLYRQCSVDQREAAVWWMQRLGLSECAETAFEKVSEGEQRLVLVTRALVKSPALLVLDEPCQGLDAGNRDRVLQAIDWVGSRPNTSMIYVTHRADELPPSITHVLRLNEGRVVSQAPIRN
jgi:molybdate transport system ATP-binding protein